MDRTTISTSINFNKPYFDSMTYTKDQNFFKFSIGHKSNHFRFMHARLMHFINKCFAKNQNKKENILAILKIIIITARKLNKIVYKIGQIRIQFCVLTLS